jgi:hypothetical protein
MRRRSKIGVPAAISVGSVMPGHLAAIGRMDLMLLTTVQRNFRDDLNEARLTLGLEKVLERPPDSMHDFSSTLRSADCDVFTS